MYIKHFIKKSKKILFLNKKLFLFGGIGIVILFGTIFALRSSDTMFTSVLKINQKARITKPKDILPTVCIDSDGGIDYTTKGTIFLSGGINRMEEDSCNTNGTLRERFCGNPGEAAGLLRSENYVDCGSERGCYQGACKSCYDPEIIIACSLELPECPSQCVISGNIINDIMITSGSFVATDNQHASMEINLKNIGTVAMHTDNIGYGISLDGNTYIEYGVDYDVQLTNSSNTILQPNETYTIFANVTLMANNAFTNNSYIHVNVSTYPDTDDIPSNNSYSLYLTGNFSSTTGQIVDCNTPENILACNLQLPSCPPECTIFTGGIGDIIIEDMSIQTNPATVGTTIFDNKVSITLKNIGNENLNIPYLNGENRFPISCASSNQSYTSTTTIGLQQNILGPNQIISTELVGQSSNMFWYGDLGNKSVTCTIPSQQEQGRTNTNPDNTQMIYESDGTNNSFVLNYEVINSTGSEIIIPGDLIIEDMYITPNNTPIVGTDNDTNKINLVIKNIGSGVINVPSGNAGPITTLGCFYSNGGYGGQWIILTGMLYPNQSIITQIERNGADISNWFNTIGPKYIECNMNNTTITNPNSTYQIYEADNTNNSFILYYEVIPFKTIQNTTK